MNWIESLLEKQPNLFSLLVWNNGCRLYLACCWSVLWPFTTQILSYCLAMNLPYLLPSAVIFQGFVKVLIGENIQCVTTKNMLCNRDIFLAMVVRLQGWWCLSVCHSVQSAPHWNVSTTTGWIIMRFGSIYPIFTHRTTDFPTNISRHLCCMFGAEMLNAKSHTMLLKIILRPPDFLLDPLEWS